MTTTSSNKNKPEFSKKNLSAVLLYKQLLISGQVDFFDDEEIFPSQIH